MTNDEFDVLDELYFVISFEELLGQVDLDQDALRQVLVELRRKEWLRVYENLDEELTEVDLENRCENYLFLASKKGLMAHNRQ